MRLCIMVIIGFLMICMSRILVPVYQIPKPPQAGTILPEIDRTIFMIQCLQAGNNITQCLCIEYGVLNLVESMEQAKVISDACLISEINSEASSI